MTVSKRWRSSSSSASEPDGFVLAQWEFSASKHFAAAVAKPTTISWPLVSDIRGPAGLLVVMVDLVSLFWQHVLWRSMLLLIRCSQRALLVRRRWGVMLWSPWL